MTSDTASALRRCLAERLADEGLLHDPELRRAVETVPRETFLGSAIYKSSETSGTTVWTPVRSDSVSSDEWLRLTYQNTTWVTQIDGTFAEYATGPVTGGTPTSSSTLPGLITWMIEQAGTTRGKRVLIIGAGTGLSTAYVCELVGEDNTTAIETDPSAAERASRALTEAGYAPTLVTADGLNGYPECAPYDTVLAFCSMRHISYSLLRQVNEGGTVLVTLAGWGFGHGLVRVTADGEGGATGRFLPGYTSFMMARSHDRPPHGPIELLPGEQRESRVDPTLLDDWSGRFVAQLAAPSAERFGAGVEQILLDVATGSQARTRAADGGEGWDVIQRGPLRLWDDVENAVEAWQSAGAPHLSEFGLTVTADAQHVWLGTPDGPRWRLPV